MQEFHYEVFEPEQMIRAMLLPRFFVGDGDDVLASSVTTTWGLSQRGQNSEKQHLTHEVSGA